MIDPVLFILSCLTLLIAPGPTNILLFTAGAALGWRPAGAMLVSVVAAYAMSITSARVLLEPVLATFPDLAKVVRVLVGLYVLWLAARLWTSTLAPSTATVVTARDLFLTTLLNPKGFVIAFVLLPAGGVTIWPHAVVVTGCIVMSCLIWIGAGAALGRLGGRARRIAPRASSLALGAFGSLAIASILG